MAVPGRWKMYDLAKKYVGDGTLDLDDTTNWKVALFLSTSNCNNLAVGTAIYGDLTNEHANANGYTTGGAALAGQSFVNAAGTVTFDSNDVLFAASGGNIVARYAVYYKNATVNGIVKPLLCVCLLDTSLGGSDVTATAGNAMTLTMSPSGVLAASGATSD